MKKGVGIIIGILFGLNIVLVTMIVLILTGVVDIKLNNSNQKLDTDNVNVDSNNNKQELSDNKNEEKNIDDDKYASIIDEYKTAMNDSNYIENMDKYSNINTNMVRFYHLYKNGVYEENMVINYAYYDINKDGSNEMIVTDTNNIIEIYTYDGNKANAFFKDSCLGERCNAHIYENGLIYFYGAGGASLHGLTFYKIGADGYSKDIVKDFGVEIHDGVYTIESDGVITDFKSDEEVINSVVGNTKKVDLSRLNWKEIK